MRAALIFSTSWSLNKSHMYIRRDDPTIKNRIDRIFIYGSIGNFVGAREAAEKCGEIEDV